jgi:hypothetical protein
VRCNGGNIYVRKPVRKAGFRSRLGQELAEFLQRQLCRGSKPTPRRDRSPQQQGRRRCSSPVHAGRMARFPRRRTKRRIRSFRSGVTAVTACCTYDSGRQEGSGGPLRSPNGALRFQVLVLVSHKAEFAPEMRPARCNSVPHITGSMSTSRRFGTRAGARSQESRGARGTRGAARTRDRIISPGHGAIVEPARVPCDQSSARTREPRAVSASLRPPSASPSRRPDPSVRP